MRKVHWLYFGLVLCLLFGLPFAHGKEAQDTFPRVPQAVILSLTGNHYSGITRALSTVGFQVREVSAEGYGSSRERPPLLIIPEKEGQQLAPTLVQTILHDVEGGMPLLLDGSTPLAEELGVKATRHSRR